ncbi:MAG TPA: hypothetical protein VK583_12080, partial [Burkholderiales bacterium]|nr:hypothetical protein [Burkholderiales bacterium]
RQSAKAAAFAIFTSCIEPAMTSAKAAAFADWRIAVTWLHAASGTLTALTGLWIVLQMNNVLPRSLHVAAWKNLMRAAFAGYWLTALLGFATYYFWYLA